MKDLIKTRFNYLLFTIFYLTTLIGLPGCGGNKEQTSIAQTDSIQTKVTNPEIAIDSMATAALIDSNLKQEINKESKKEILSADKKKDAELVNKKTVTQTVISKTNAPIEKTVTTIPKVSTPTPVTTPTPVVKPAEPVKDIPGAQPKPSEIPKPAPAITTKPEQGSWIVPAKYKSMTSPSPADNESIALGKSLYGTHCKSCHGSKGIGDGPKSNTLDTKIGSFLSAGFRAQNQGEVYYKSMVGRGDMPRYEKKIPDNEEQWSLVHYIMSLK